jgi:signal transduction histidine kinase
VKTLLAALLLTVTCTAPAEVRADARAVRDVQWVQHWPPGMPGDDSAWEPLSLPHNWYLRPPELGSRGWYRLRFDLDYVPLGSQSLYFHKLVLGDITVYVNGRAVWKLSEAYAPGVALTATRITIPLELLREGENTIHLYAIGNPRWFHGVSSAYLGDTSTLSGIAAMRNLMQGQMIHIVAAAFGAVGLLSLWLWLRAGREPILFWYGVSGVMLLVATALWYFSMWLPDLGGWRTGLIFMRYHGYLVPFFILHLRLAGRRHFWLEGALWLVLLIAFFSFGIPGDWRPGAWVGWGIAFSALPALLTIPLLISPRLRSRPGVLLLVIADFAACLLPLHDWAVRFGLLDFDRPYLIYFAPPFVMLAAAVPILDRMMAGVRATERNRRELEQRVAEKTLEIEASHETLRQVQRAQALAEERRRIMADMHDGLGARLVALLSVAQSGKAKHGEISEGIAAALDELRLTVDSVQPVEGDVGVVLGNVRHRMRSVFERAGVQLAWNVSELPRMEDLTPERILAIQRIFLEAFTNALRHSRARTVSVFTMRVPGAVRIVIEDDGRGFDVGAARAGNGLHNLQLRALQAGGTLSVESTPGKGTRVTLSLPLYGEGTPEPLPNTGQKTTEYPVHGIAANAASS